MTTPNDQLARIREFCNSVAEHDPGYEVACDIRDFIDGGSVSDPVTPAKIAAGADMGMYPDNLLRELLAEVERLRAQETRIRALAESGGVYEPGPDWISKRAILAALDTEGEA
ncbi:hypothetical protein M609_gp080 [Mycobacterium phage Job42]|uniref:hypothetical protein n=1 Tax=Mycobacterium phage Job42 TaxID=1327771 RepID=UPI00034273FD|nr:hypothetical protein M609_gp080 [Mycobacterium phage Job42]AGM61496.1 hypothetical protein PBI_JOB42_80 [Mycobacterium phage Job42]